MDDDGYPDDEELKRIAEWPWQDSLGLLEFVRELWRFQNFWSQDGDMLAISTGGWSGNESLVAAMKQNVGFWHLCWESHSRGGHFVFDLSRAKTFSQKRAGV